MQQPHITYRANGELSSLSGKEAVELMRVQTIISGIAMNLLSGGKMQLTRTATIGNLLKLATTYTGKKYSSRNDGDKQCAMIDLQLWFALMKSTIPESTEGEVV